MNPNLPTPSRLRQLLWALPVPGLLIVLDCVMRGGMIAKLPPDFKAYYASSVVFGVVFWYWFLAAANALFARRFALGVGFVAAGALLFTVVVLSAYAFFDHFGALPNLFAFEYIIDEPRDCWAYAKAAMQPMQLAAMLSITIGLSSYLMYAARRPAVAAGWRNLGASSAVLAVCCLFMHNNVRMGPNSFTPDVHAVFSLSKAVENALTGDPKVEVVSAAAREPVDAKFGPLPFNVLLILNESMRAKSLTPYGYFRDTTPHLQKFFDHRAANVVRFDRAYANATRTMLAFPSFFTGVVPSQAGGLLHRVPAFFDYGRAFSGVSTFLISTQSMHWGNFDKFLDLQRLSFSWYKENSEFANTDADRFESLDDKMLPDALARFLANRDQKTNFYGAIQLTNTHAPYGFDKESDIWHDERLTNGYDNSIHYNDRQFARVISLLRAHDLLTNTLIISTSDHGEAFGEHGYYGHLNTFYDEEARVPLWIHLPDQLAKDTALVERLRVNAKNSVSNADVIPTVVSLVSGARYGELAGITSQLTGAPLDRKLPEKRAILMQNYNDVDEKTMFVGLGLVVGKYKYLLKFNQAKGEEELYDLDADPKEQVNVWATASDELKQLIYRHLLSYKNSKELLHKAFPERTRHT